MRIESEHGGHCANRLSPFTDRADDQLMTEMQSIKHPEREHRRALNVSVFSSVEETHQSWVRDKLSSNDHFPFVISHLSLGSKRRVAKTRRDKEDHNNGKC